MIRHIHQDFLLSCGYETVRPEALSVPWEEVGWHLDVGEPRCLLDGTAPLVRKLSVSLLAAGLSTKDDWEAFVAQLRGIATVILVDDRPAATCPIVARYADSTLRAFIFRLQEAGIACRVTKEVV